VRLERLVQVTAHEFDLRLEFAERDGLGPRHIRLQPAPGVLAGEESASLKAGALHLLGHYLDDLREASSEAVRLDERMPRFSAMWHALEDARVENRMIERWPGMRATFEARAPRMARGSLLRILAWEQQLEMALYLFGRGQEWAEFHPKVRIALASSQETIVRGARGHHPSDSLSAMREIYPHLAHLVERGHASRPGHTDVDEARANAAATNGSQEGGASGAPPEIEMSDERVEVSVRGELHELPEWYRPGSAPWFERGLGAKQIHPSALRSDRQTIVAPPAGDAQAYMETWGEVRREAGFLQARMRNLVLEQVYLRFGGHFRSGTLHTSKLWKQRLGDYRLFERSVTREHSAAFSLLVDESASMQRGEKMRMARKAALLLGETLRQMDMPFEIIGFSTAEFEARAAMRLGLVPAHAYRTMRCSPLEHRIYKRFDEPYGNVRARLTGMTPRHNNWDEEHLLFAFRRLQDRREGTRVMIVISDGQPNGDADHVIRTVRSLEGQGVKVIGVGLGADYVQRIYRHAVVVTGFRQLAESLSTILAFEIARALSPRGLGPHPLESERVAQQRPAARA
jgi:Cobalamin biosynthesis protein CobT VWA domain